MSYYMETMFAIMARATRHRRILLILFMVCEVAMWIV